MILMLLRSTLPLRSYASAKNEHSGNINIQSLNVGNFHTLYNQLPFHILCHVTVHAVATMVEMWRKVPSLSHDGVIYAAFIAIKDYKGIVR